MGTVVKAKVSELEDDTRKLFYGRVRKDFDGVLQEVSGKRRFFAMFQYGWDTDIHSNKLIIMIV